MYFIYRHKINTILFEIGIEEAKKWIGSKNNSGLFILELISIRILKLLNTVCFLINLKFSRDFLYICFSAKWIEMFVELLVYLKFLIKRNPE